VPLPLCSHGPPMGTPGAQEASEPKGPSGPGARMTSSLCKFENRYTWQHY